jgi:hypothetical protein
MNVIEYRGKQVAELIDGEVKFFDGVHHKIKAAVLRSMDQTADAPQAAEKKEIKRHDPEPAQHLRAGDKTVAWALWLKRNDPKEFERRFFGRKIMLEKTETTNTGDDK